MPVHRVELMSELLCASCGHVLLQQQRATVGNHASAYADVERMVLQAANTFITSGRIYGPQSWCCSHPQPETSTVRRSSR